jgi:hypothetical protein
VQLSALTAKYDVGRPLTGASMNRLKRALLTLLALGAVLAGIAWATFQLPTFGGHAGPILLERMRASKQFHGGRFENTPPYVSNLSFSGELKSYLGDEVREPQFEVPVKRIGPRELARPVPSGLRARWLGHATVLLEIDGLGADRSGAVATRFALPVHRSGAPAPGAAGYRGFEEHRTRDQSACKA